MSKTKTTYYCQSCGGQSPKWTGKCSHCGEWNTLVEEAVTKDIPPREWRQASGTTARRKGGSSSAQLSKLNEIQQKPGDRLVLPDNELNRVLGGGLVPGSLVLLGGEPGIGKSTLLLQLALQLKGLKVLYISGEESREQIRMRSLRLNPHGGTDCYVLAETATQSIFKEIEDLEPDLVVVDSVQTLHTGYLESAPGSISQIRECSAEFMKYAKETGTPVFLVGHITKDGSIAGPKLLEHMVDTVLQFEGDQHYNYRVLRSVKNRFGSTSELGIYEMSGQGLREVSNPSEILLSQREEWLSGIAVCVPVEGLRPIMVESQALVSPSAYGTPQRSATGFDPRRLHMLLAVLEKRVGFRLGQKDVFLNIAGGIRVDDPAMDLGIMSAIISSHEDQAINYKYGFAGEVGLSGEVRAVNRVEQRISEAGKLGFEKIFVSRYNFSAKKQGHSLGEMQKKHAIEIVAISKMQDLMSRLFV